MRPLSVRYAQVKYIYMVDLSEASIPRFSRGIYKVVATSPSDAIQKAFDQTPFKNDITIRNSLEDIDVQKYTTMVGVSEEESGKIANVSRIHRGRFLSKYAQSMPQPNPQDQLSGMERREYWEISYTLYNQYGEKKLRHKRKQTREEMLNGLYQLKQSPYVKNVKVKHFIEYSEDVDVVQ